MKRLWWWFRLLVLFIFFVALGLYLFTRTPWAAQLNTLLGRTPDFSATLAEGDHLIAAIHRFREKNGLWPEYLDDLPAATPPPSHEWFYELVPISDPAGEFHILPSLSIHPPHLDPGAHLGYDFDPRSPSWHLFGNGEDRVLRADSPAPPSTMPIRQLRIVQLQELTRRIEREPADVDHYRAKAAILLELHRNAEARQLVEQAAAALPASYWPRMALAALDLSAISAPSTQPSPATQPLPPSIQAFADWLQLHPTMTHWFYLSVLHRRAGDDDAAASDMLQAIKQPIEVTADDPNITPYYLWDMARWALDTRRWDLAIQICDAWDLAVKDGAVVEQSFRPLRAAAELASGNLNAARADLAAIPATPPTGKPLWAQNLDGLQNAITRADRAYRYKPGPHPAEFQVFLLPE